MADKVKLVHKPYHFMRLGMFGEQVSFVDEFESLYDVILFNANLVAYAPDGVSALMLGKLQNKPYLIDPLTHAFGHTPTKIAKDPANFDPENPRIKPSVEAMATKYGEPVRRLAGYRALDPSDFLGKIKVVEEFCQRVINFQKQTVGTTAEDIETSKYLLFELKNKTSPRFPIGVIAPYFYMNSASINEWLPVNTQLLSISAQLEKELAVYGEIVISRDVLETKEYVEQIISKYTAVRCKGFLVWIDGFSEHRASEPLLRAFKDLVTGLSSKGREVINLFGGYFSIALSKHGLSGVCHGPEYGEDREVTPVGGGLPRSKYYLRPVHGRLPHREVAFTIRRMKWAEKSLFFENVCACETCQEVLSKDISDFARFGETKRILTRTGTVIELPTPEARELATKHYIRNKVIEFDFVRENTIGDIAAQLREALSQFKKPLGTSSIGHLALWEKVLCK